MVSASKMPKYLYVSFSPRILILSGFGVSLPSVRYYLPLFMTSMTHYSKTNPIPMSGMYILTACTRVSSSFSFFVNSFMSSLHIRWLIFSCVLLSWYPAMHFLSMWFSGSMAIMNSDDRASPLEITLLIFASGNLLPPAVNFTIHFSWFCRWNLWLHVIFCTFWGCLLSS